MPSWTVYAKQSSVVNHLLHCQWFLIQTLHCTQRSCKTVFHPQDSTNKFDHVVYETFLIGSWHHLSVSSSGQTVCMRLNYQMFVMHDTSLEWTVFLDSFCLLQNYWTWKWCNDDNKMSFFSTTHIYLSLFYWNVVIFVLTLFLRVGWIVSLHHATYSTDGGSIPVDQLLTPCAFSLYILSLTFHLPIPLFFHFRFRFSILFDTCPWFPFSPHSPPPKFILSLQLYSFLFPSLFLSFSTSSFSISYLIFVCNSLLNFALITSMKSLMWAFHRKYRSSRKEFLTIYRLHTIIFTYAHRD